ncbi:MAG TPA: OsmC family protein [Pseudomonadales bacterium]|jgi:organic hydroperoxide reductase OsmC/OhrA
MDDGIRISWNNTRDDFDSKTYTRNHHWQFSNGVDVPVSAAVKYAGDPACINPEQGLVASVASCHMLTFLALTAKAGFVLTAYDDTPYGVLAKNDAGRIAVTHITLRPRTRFAGKAPSACELNELHDAAHRNCFVANSLNSLVAVKPVMPMDDARKLADCKSDTPKT